jgi:hypothetical protein
MWKPIPETDSKYEVSDTGEVRNVPYLVTVSRNGTEHSRFTTGKVLEQQKFRRKPTAPEYAAVYLRIGGKVVRRSVHTLVLSAFVGLRTKEQQCRHLDGNSLNNRVENLAWGTAAENRADITRHGRTAAGERNGRATLAQEDVLAIRVMSGRGMSTYQLSQWFNVHPSTIQRIALNILWPKLVAAVEAPPKEKGL